MQIASAASVLTLVLASAVSACRFERDEVAPGYYGPMPAGSRSVAGGPAKPANATAGSSGGQGLASSPVSSPPSSSAAGAPSPSPSPSPMVAAGSGGSASTSMDAKPAGGPTPCDLSGRWLSTYHLVSDALGELQYGHYFEYYEIEQTGEAFTIKKGLLCGYDSVGGGLFAATADFRGSWAGTISKLNYNGRTGTSTSAASGCKVDLQKRYTVRGATAAHYTDPAIPLPSAEQKASGTTPGWEDWDGDGNPGITGTVSGIVSGKIFVAPRMWTSISGTAADVSSTFKVPVQWNQEPNVMSYDGTPLLGSEAVRAADASLHFAQFARLRADQATGDDAAICKSVVELAATLTPAAAGM